MAKKAAAKAKKKMKPGYKACPHCSASIPARSATCPKCHEPIAPKKKKPAKAAKAAKAVVDRNGYYVPKNGPASHVDVIRLAQQFVSVAGGTSEAAEILQALGGNEKGNG